MNRSDYVMAVLAAAGGTFTPVQIQKLFFIIEMKAGNQIGKHFDFHPYNYGPYDPAVYHEIERLASRGLAVVEGQGSRFRRYGITAAGAEEAKSVLDTLSPPMRQYFGDVANFVRSRSFAELVSAVYREWPEMKAKSIFREEA